MEKILQLPYSTIIGALEYRAQVSPNKTAVFYPNPSKNYTEYASLTYKQYNNVLNHLAEKIYKHLPSTVGHQESITCGILATGGIDYLLTEYALLKIPNVVMFPISARNSQAAIEHLIRETKTVLILTTHQYLPLLQTIQQQEEFKAVQVLLLNDGEFDIDELLKRKDEESTTAPKVLTMREKNDADVNKIMMILHSSGSTAHPKPIYLANRYFLLGVFSFLSINQNYWTENDVILVWGALYHLLAFNGTCRSAITGCTYALPLCVNFPPKPEELLRNIQVQNKITALITVPSLLEVLVRELTSENHSHIGLAPLKALRFLMYGGAGCPDDICRTLVDNGVILLTVYGATETGIVLGKNFEFYDKQWKTGQIPPLRKPYIRLESPPQSQNPNEKILIHLPNDPFLAENVSTSSDGTYTVGDILLEDPPNSGLFMILGRLDDTLVHVNGEKTNPLPMEDIIRRSPLVKQVAVVGHNQFCTAALIQLNMDEAFKFEFKEIEEQVWAAVEEANHFAPSHSRLLRPLVKILPMNRVLPVTDKGNLMRRKVTQEYGDIISNMFDKFLGQQQQQPTNSHKDDSARTKSTSSWTKVSIENYLKEKCKSACDSEEMILSKNLNRSIFDFGINSLQVVELRNSICQDICEVPKNFVYENSSIVKMTDSLWNLLHHGENSSQDDDPSHYKLTEELVEKYIEMMKSENVKIAKPIARTERIFLITGANGSLGSFAIRDLLRLPSSTVKRIYCLLRGSNPKQRLIEAFEQRQLETTSLLDALDEKESRLVVLPSLMDVSDPHLGQTEEIYRELQNNVTDIIHSAWKMNFNQTVKDFEQDSIYGVYNLLKLACSNGMQFHFISSIASAGSGFLTSVKEEPLPRTAEVALPQGYGQSKYVSEHLCWAAMSLWHVPVNVFRVGQISGDTQNGVWNTTEMAPMMIYAGAGRLKKMPNVGDSINWIPVDVCSAALVDLALKSSFDVSTPKNERVYHLLNPHSIDYDEYLNGIRSAGLHFDVVSPKEFIDTVLSTTDTTNPLVKLSSFFEQVYGKKKGLIRSKYETGRTVERCETLKQCPRIDGNLIGRYLNYWRQCQVLKD